jgi:hypothetical protein
MTTAHAKSLARSGARLFFKAHIERHAVSAIGKVELANMPAVRVDFVLD